MANVIPSQLMSKRFFYVARDDERPNGGTTFNGRLSRRIERVGVLKRIGPASRQTQH